jgi:hypothetical protein
LSDRERDHHRGGVRGAGDSEVKSLAEFVALARAKPDTLNVAAAAGIPN